MVFGKAYVEKLLILIWIFSVGVFADEEVGIPYIEPDKGVIDSAVLAPDGNSFYTLKGTLVTQWQITPLKKLHSFKTNIMTYHKNGSAKYRIHINISNDNKRVILYSPKEIQLWDIKSKKHLKTNKFKDYVYSGVRSKYGFLTIGEENILTIWNDENLTLKNTIRMNKFIRLNPSHMLIGDNILIVSYGGNDFIYFNLDTFKLEYSTRAKENLHELFKVKMNEFATRIQKKYPHKFNSYELYFYLKRTSEHNPKTMSFYKGINDNHTNEIGLLEFLGYGFRKVFVNKLGKVKKRFYSLYQFDDTIIVEYGGTFTGIGNIKKYIKMKTKDGKIIPINNVTLQKYNKKINLKD